MADISQYLQDILDAVYGEQVRGSIHDAIEIINEVSEVVLSVGTAVTSPSSSSTGFFTDSIYLNTNTYDLWKCLGQDSWQKVGNLRGIGISRIDKTITVENVDTYTIIFDDGSTETFDVTNGIDGTNGSTWYKGTALSGTGMSITGFPGVKNDYYLNSNTGGVYVCVRTGGAIVPDAAEWDYVMTLSGGGGGSSIVVIDNLNSGSSTDALSANQGRVLNNKIANKADADSLAVVATSGNYNDLIDKPDLTSFALKSELIQWATDTQTAGGTNLMFYNAAFHATSKVFPFADDGTGVPVKYTSITVSEGTCLIQYPALKATTSFAIGILN